MRWRAHTRRSAALPRLGRLMMHAWKVYRLIDLRKVWMRWRHAGVEVQRYKRILGTLYFRVLPTIYLRAYMRKWVYNVFKIRTARDRRAGRYTALQGPFDQMRVFSFQERRRRTRQ